MFYKSSRTPNPGPVGGSVKLVRPLIGSLANLSIRLPGFGTLPSRRSFKMSCMSFSGKTGVTTSLYLIRAGHSFRVTVEKQVISLSRL